MKEYNWNPNAKIEDVKRHLDSLNAVIKYHENRGNSEKILEFENEKNQIIKFYKL
jgi:hypothetical protein